MWARPGDNFWEVLVSRPRAELGEVGVQEPGALVLLYGAGERDGRRRAASCSAVRPPGGSRGRRTPPSPAPSTAFPRPPAASAEAGTLLPGGHPYSHLNCKMR